MVKLHTCVATTLRVVVVWVSLQAEWLGLPGQRPHLTSWVLCWVGSATHSHRGKRACWQGVTLLLVVVASCILCFPKPIRMLLCAASSAVSLL